MPSSGETRPPHPHAPPSPFETILLALSGSVAAGSLEGAVRASRNPLLYDSRLDALSLVLWAIGVAAAFGILAGIPSALLIRPRWGATAAALWAPLWAALAWSLSALLARRLGEAPGAWIGIAAGFLLATLCAALVGRRASSGPALRGAMLRVVLPLIVFSLLVPGFFAGRLILDLRRPAAGAPSIVLITVDTLRADAIGAYRQGREVLPSLERARTPRFDALADEGVLFEQASTPLPKTPEAIASLMTGSYPESHGLRNLFLTLGRPGHTLAESLRGNGWMTRAVVTNLLVSRWSGLAQGFDRYRGKDGLRPQVQDLAVIDLLRAVFPALAERALNRFEVLRSGRETAGETTDRAVAMLRGLGSRPYFLWVHYLDPHWPYWPPEPFRSRADTEPGAPFTLYDDVDARRPPIGDLIFRNTLPAATVTRALSLYAGEVSYTDDEIGRLLDAVRALPRGASTIVVLSADHGEGLGEHRFHFSHGDEVYESSVRIPLIVTRPGGGRGLRVKSPVSLVDVMPTLLELAGVAIPKGVEGNSLVPLLAGEGGSKETPGLAARTIFSESDLAYLPENPFITIPGEGGKLRSIRVGSLKLIRFPRDVEAARRIDPDLGAGNSGLMNPIGRGEATHLGPSAPDRIELYDLASDPGESRNIQGTAPRLEAEMIRSLDAWLLASGRGSGPMLDASDEMLREIQALGYIDRGGEKH